MGQTFRINTMAAVSPFNPPVMAREVMSFKPATDADALRVLRARYPDAPLSMRVAALDYLLRRKALPEPAGLAPKK
jgi:hypothetical protein